MERGPWEGDVGGGEGPREHPNLGHTHKNHNTHEKQKHTQHTQHTHLPHNTQHTHKTHNTQTQHTNTTHTPQFGPKWIEIGLAKVGHDPPGGLILGASERSLELDLPLVRRALGEGGSAGRPSTPGHLFLG